MIAGVPVLFDGRVHVMKYIKSSEGNEVRMWKLKAPAAVVEATAGGGGAAPFVGAPWMEQLKVCPFPSPNTVNPLLVPEACPKDANTVKGCAATFCIKP